MTVSSQESASARFSATESRTGWWCRIRGATEQLVPLSSPSPATPNVNSGLCRQFDQVFAPASKRAFLSRGCDLSSPDAGGTWLGRASAPPSAAWGIVPWKYTAPKSAAPTARPRKSTTASAAGSTSLIIRRAATETVTRVAGTTRPGQK